MERWRSRKMVKWRMEKWRDEEMERWRNGEMEIKMELSRDGENENK